AALPDQGVPFAELHPNQALSGQEIRARYFDGQTWHDEAALTSDALYDSNPVVAFNDAGRGVVAWTSNTSYKPFTDAGLDRKSNEIAVAVWDPAAHAFGPAQVLTSDDESDSRPVVFAAQDGMLYAVWIHEDAAAKSSLLYSVYDGGAWSKPA